MLACTSCGPGLQSHRETARTASDSFVRAVGERDVVAIAKHFGTPLAFGGMYFASAECLQKFPAPTVIPPEKQADFAACLATLMLASSERSDEMWNVAVYDYAPGIEIEAKFDDLGGGPKLTWIGYSGRRGLLDGLPTIAPSALEAVRVEGDPKGRPSPEDAAKLAAEYSRIETDPAWAWLQVCLDAEGAITGVHAREASTPLASKVFTEVAQRWKFKPIVLGGTNPVPACALVRLSHPAMESPEILPVAFDLPDGTIRVSPTRLKRVVGDPSIIPDDNIKGRMMDRHMHRLVGSFMYCFDETGSVTSVRAIDSTGMSEYDAEIVNGVGTWKYQPYIYDGKPAKVCSAVTFVYTQSY